MQLSLLPTRKTSALRMKIEAKHQETKMLESGKDQA